MGAFGGFFCGSFIRKDFVRVEPAAGWHAGLSRICYTVRAEPLEVPFASACLWSEALILRAAYFFVASDGPFKNGIVITAEPGCKGAGFVVTGIPRLVSEALSLLIEACCASH